MTEILEDSINQATFIAASPEKVYDTISSGAGWNSFFTHDSEVDPRPGGKIVFRWKDWGPDCYNVEAEGKVLEADRPKRFVFEWYPIGRENPTAVEFNLIPEQGGATVRLKEHGYLDTPEGRRMILECASGWGEALTLLKFYLEHGVTYSSAKKRVDG